MWLMSATCCQSNNTVIYCRCVDTWTWAPPVANTPIFTRIQDWELKHLKVAHTDIQLRKHLCTLKFCHMAEETNCIQNVDASSNNLDDINDLSMKSVALCIWNLLQLRQRLLEYMSLSSKAHLISSVCLVKVKHDA